VNEQSEFHRRRAVDRTVFEISALEHRFERWRQTIVLVVGLAGVWLGHEVATWASDPSSTSVRLWTTALVSFALLQVGRASWSFVTSVSASQARVFRWRHLALCGVGLLAVAGAFIAWLLESDPLGELFTSGTVTAVDIAHVGVGVAVAFCLVGAITALLAAIAEFRSEHAWARSTKPPPG
jgi:hypothetical protein